MLYEERGDDFAHQPEATPDHPAAEPWEYPAVGVSIDVHPAYTVECDATEVCRWAAVFDGGGFGVGPLPHVGGWADQPARLMAAATLVRGVRATLRRDREGGER